MDGQLFSSMYPRPYYAGSIVGQVCMYHNFFVVVDPDSTRILVTGGGSVNASILQIIADVFNAPVLTQVSEYWPFFSASS